MGAAQQSSGSVLIVEDDDSTREALQSILQAEGYRVALAVNGREAINYLRRGNRPNLILLDLMMPVMNGWEFRSEQRHDPDLATIPVVVCSAAGNIQQEVSLIGAAGYLQKPIDTDQLLEIVRANCR